MKSKTTKSLLFLSLAGIATTSFGILPMGDNSEVMITGTASMVSTDNLELASSGEVDDFIFTFSPGVEFLFNSRSASTAKLSYVHDFRFHNDRSDLDEDYANVKLDAKYDSGVVLVTLNANYRELASNSLNDAVTGSDELIRRDQASASGMVQYRFSELTALRLGVDYSSMEYDDVNRIDRASVSVPVTFLYAIQPKLDLTVSYRYREVDVDEIATYTDPTDQMLSVGFEGELFSPKITGYVGFGFQEREYDQKKFDNLGNVVALDEMKEESVSYDASVTYAVSPKMTTSLGISRDYRNTGTDGGTYSFSSISLSSDYRISQLISTYGQVSIAKSSYENDPREEDITRFRLGTVITPNDYLSIRAEYMYRDSDSNGTGGTDFTENRFNVSASVRY